MKSQKLDTLSLLQSLPYLTLQTTSSLFSKLLVAVRNVLLVLWGVAMYGDTVSPEQLLGYLITLAAFVMYTYYKHQESSVHISGESRAQNV
jgi:hypothetical protein